MYVLCACRAAADIRLDQMVEKGSEIKSTTLQSSFNLSQIHRLNKLLNRGKLQACI